MPYTTLQPGEVWKTYVGGKIFKGGGNSSEPKMVRQNRLRAADFDIQTDDNGAEWVMPNEKKGLSFADSIERLEKLKISGHVWELNDSQDLPDGLVINYKDKDHPLVNVSRKTSIAETIRLLNELGSRMVSTGQKITRQGKAVATSGGAAQ